MAASNQVEEELRRKEEERLRKEEEARQAKLEEVNKIYETVEQQYKKILKI